MATKISKSMKVELIIQFFRNKGQRMTNLGKTDMTKLDSIIAKYNIDIEYESQKHTEQKQKDKKEKEERDRLHKEQCEKMRLEREAEDAKMTRLWSSITKKEQLWVCDRLMSHVNQERQKNNETAIKTTDVMEAMFKKDGARVIRESPNELRVNGILVCNNYIEKMITIDEVSELMPSHLKWYKNSIKDVEFIIERKLRKGKKIEFIICEIKGLLFETKCGCVIQRNSREHDECRCDNNGENWICADCYNGEYEEVEYEKETKYTCEECGAHDEDEVGISTGTNGIEKRVCECCDIDGSNYSGWGDDKN